ncbi:hypothetical protein [Polyangium aurulentum]|uniref:hypothetical protein n=1 Tax=Polyangium aurulentum TaxID=2567896 RepID=UPI0010AEC8DE|nr:hypothetical protein [Polyangium aurulentum]UQA56104.1 hypothetical protein E8A73_032975 [Polyangium aurulentum]
MKRPRPRAARALAAAFVLVTAALTAAGCGGAMSGGAQEPAMTADRAMVAPPSTVDEALAQLDTAELDVNRSLGYPATDSAPQQYAQPPGGAPQAGAAQTAPSPPPPPASPQPIESKKAEVQTSGDAAEAASSAPPPDPCTTACRALASMGRAADHLCGLAGAEDPRCDNARQRLSAAQSRVRQSCPGCNAVPRD